MPLMDEISVQRLDWREWSTLAPTWERIHNMRPDASFFLSREWVDCWLATFGEDLNPDLLAFVGDGDVVGCCLLVWRTQWVRGIPLRRVYLNCAGENEADSTCIEFNSLLSLAEYEEQVAGALVTFLRSHKWDELLLPGVVEQDAVRILASSLGENEIEEVLSRYIDFTGFRDPPVDFLSSLSSKTRYHIRRTRRSYEEIGGACTLRVAQTAEEALGMLQQLAELHQARWKGRGHPGAFNSPKFTGFHEMMIRQEFDRTLLFRVQAGAEVVGLLYCFLFRGWVYYYQSGISYTLDNRRNPGLLTLYLTISHCLERPEFKGFDLMAGDNEYKRSLASTHRPLRWIVVRRPTVPSLLYRGLRSVKRAYVQILKKTRRSNQPSDGIQPSAD
jgi:hypothetical protein